MKKTVACPSSLNSKLMIFFFTTLEDWFRLNDPADVYWILICRVLKSLVLNSLPLSLYDPRQVHCCLKFSVKKRSLNSVEISSAWRFYSYNFLVRLCGFATYWLNDVQLSVWIFVSGMIWIEKVLIWIMEGFQNPCRNGRLGSFWHPPQWRTNALSPLRLSE